MAGLLCRAGLVFARRPRQPRHDQACHDESEETQQQPLPMTAARQSRSQPGRCSSAAAGCRRTRAPAVGTTGPCEPSTKGRRRRSRRARRPPAHASTSVSVSFIVVLAVRPASPCLPWRPNATRSNSRSRARPPAAPASRNACPDGVCPARGRARRRAASEPTTDQPISPIMPRPNQTPCVELRRALSLRAAFAPTCSAKVGSFFDVFCRLVIHVESSRSDAEIPFPVSP